MIQISLLIILSINHLIYNDPHHKFPESNRTPSHVSFRKKWFLKIFKDEKLLLLLKTNVIHTL